MTQASTTNYASLPVSFVVNNATVPAPAIRLVGPGEVTSMDARAVIRTDPRDGVDAFEPNYLATVEFDLPDFPWMFTPAAANGVRLRPWICLAVVPDTDGVAVEGLAGGITVLRIDAPLDPKAELPDLDPIDSWAHAQVTGDSLSGKAPQRCAGWRPDGTILAADRAAEAGTRASLFCLRGADLSCRRERSAWTSGG